MVENTINRLKWRIYIHIINCFIGILLIPTFPPNTQECNGILRILKADSRDVAGSAENR